MTPQVRTMFPFKRSLKCALLLVGCGACFLVLLSVQQLDNYEENASALSKKHTWASSAGHENSLNDSPYLRKHPNNNRCKARTNFVYLKMFKCASETLVNIFRRFGYGRNLSFVLPLSNKIYLGWPYPITDQYYKPSKTGGFNILCDHVVYDKDVLNDLMPKDTVYITSLREPFSQFKSTFNYYAFQRVANLTGTGNPLADYLLNVEHYDDLYKSKEHSKTRYCVPDGMSMSKNLMSFNLGFPTGYPSGKADMTKNATFIEEWINHIDSRFEHVIITEYFPESIILLKRSMCWQLKDILYHSQNVGVYAYRNENQSALVDIYRQWSSIDYRLYHHFNNTLWNKLSRMDEDYWEEVLHYKTVVKDISLFCDKLVGQKELDEMTVLEISDSLWNERFLVDLVLCEEMVNNALLPKLLHNHYANIEPQLPEPEPSIKYC